MAGPVAGLVASRVPECRREKQSKTTDYADGTDRTTEFFRDAKAPVFRFFVPFVAFCRLFRTAGGRIPTEANKGNEELGQGQEGERGSIGRGINENVGRLDTLSPNAQPNPLCEDFCHAPLGTDHAKKSVKSVSSVVKRISHPTGDRG